MRLRIDKMDARVEGVIGCLLLKGRVRIVYDRLTSYYGVLSSTLVIINRFRMSRCSGRDEDVEIRFWLGLWLVSRMGDEGLVLLERRGRLLLSCWVVYWRRWSHLWLSYIDWVVVITIIIIVVVVIIIILIWSLSFSQSLSISFILLHFK